MFQVLYLVFKGYFQILTLKFVATAPFINHCSHRVNHPLSCVLLLLVLAPTSLRYHHCSRHRHCHQRSHYHLVDTPITITLSHQPWLITLVWLTSVSMFDLRILLLFNISNYRDWSVLSLTRYLLILEVKKYFLPYHAL